MAIILENNSWLRAVSRVHSRFDPEIIHLSKQDRGKVKLRFSEKVTKIRRNLQLGFDVTVMSKLIGRFFFKLRGLLILY